MITINNLCIFVSAYVIFFSLVFLATLDFDKMIKLEFVPK